MFISKLLVINVKLAVITFCEHVLNATCRKQRSWSLKASKLRFDSISWGQSRRAEGDSPAEWKPRTHWLCLPADEINSTRVGETKKKKKHNRQYPYPCSWDPDCQTFPKPFATLNWWYTNVWRYSVTVGRRGVCFCGECTSQCFSWGIFNIKHKFCFVQNKKKKKKKRDM